MKTESFSHQHLLHTYMSKGSGKKPGLFRGAITKKKRENLGKIPKGGGGLKKTDENSPFQFGNFEIPGGEVSIFQKCLNYK